MKTITLTQDQLTEILRAHMQRVHGHLASIKDVEFGEEDGEVVAHVAVAEFNSEQKFDGVSFKQSKAARDTFDVFTNNSIETGTSCIWIAGVGITAAHPDRWPELLREKLGPEMRRDTLEHLGLEKKQASAAADILGGSGGATDRGSALGGALEDV